VTVEDRFWSKVIKGDDCWLWAGGRGQRGYGRFWYQGRMVPAHRMAWALEHAQVFPDDKGALHRCDNPPCVNPAHVFPGTPGDNLHDSIAKGRFTPRAFGLLGGRPIGGPPRGPAAVNAEKTHCFRGHPFDEANTYLRPSGARRCRACGRIAWHQRKAYEAEDE
jgi:hypothetical protein